uniref:U3 small nucleolar RNA-associated protein 6 n=1 Tax=Sipha flava TaxID=143950 RepID=A0A2S2QRE6_9HEMI
MAEFVQHRKEQMMIEIPMLKTLFDERTVKRILKKRENFEYGLMRRNKTEADFKNYIAYLKSIIKKVEQMDTPNIESSRLINKINTRITFLYRAALKYFIADVKLWKEYIKFLIKIKRKELLHRVIDKALSLHGNISDELYVFAVKSAYPNIQKIREMYTIGIHTHKTSSDLHYYAFKYELAFSEILRQKVLAKEKEVSDNDPALNGSVAQVIFQSATDTIKSDINVFFKMLREASQYSFANNLVNEIKSYMLSKFGCEPKFWNEFATRELINESIVTEKLRIKNCLDKYDQALSFIDTDEMWDYYLTTILELTSDTEKTEIYKRNLLRQSMFNAHQKNKLKPKHYIAWMNKSKSSSMFNEIVDWATEKYPNDQSILDKRIERLANNDKLLAYKIFKENIHIVSPSVWLIMVQCFSNESQLSEIFNMAFEDNSTCAIDVKKKLGNEYLLWLSKNKSLTDSRNAYNKLMINNFCDASLCKTQVTIEIEQEKIDVTKIRQHFTLACMKFGKENIDLWMDRIFFELKYGSPKMVSNIYHQALTTLNNEESDTFAEEYALKASTFNQHTCFTIT